MKGISIQIYQFVYNSNQQNQFKRLKIVQRLRFIVSIILLTIGKRESRVNRGLYPQL